MRPSHNELRRRASRRLSRPESRSPPLRCVPLSTTTVYLLGRHHTAGVAWLRPCSSAPRGTQTLMPHAPSPVALAIGPSIGRVGSTRGLEAVRLEPPPTQLPNWLAPSSPPSSPPARQLPNRAPLPAPQPLTPPACDTTVPSHHSAQLPGLPSPSPAVPQRWAVVVNHGGVGCTRASLTSSQHQHQQWPPRSS